MSDFENDVIAESPPPTKLIRKVIRKKPRKTQSSQLNSAVTSQCANTIIYNINTIGDCPNTVFKPNAVREIKRIRTSYEHLLNNSRESEASFSKVHFFRTVSEILNLGIDKNFIYNNVRVFGLYNFGIMKKTDKFKNHFLKCTKSNDKILIDLNTCEFPQIGSTILLFGFVNTNKIAISKNFNNTPHIVVRFWRYVSNLEAIEKEFQFQKLYTPKRFDLVIKNTNTTLVDDSYLEYNNTADFTFNEFCNTVFLNSVDSDELLYYELQTLMNIDTDVFK